MLVIIGCGNTNRSDDGVGIFVAEQLKSFLSKNPKDNVKVFDAGTSGMDIMFMARGCQELIIIDANTSQSEPGSIYEVPGEEVENILEPGFNLHDFRWDNALYAGKKIFKADFPKDVLVYLIEAQSLEFGVELSPVVSNAANKVINKIKKKIIEYNE